MDYCSTRNQIATYASSSSTGGVMLAKNIDCVTLDADLVACDTLTIQGQSITGITDVTTKTQNMAATAGNTVFAGNVIADDLEVHRITAVDSNAGVSVLSKVEQNINSSTGGVTLYLTNASLGTATTNYMGFLMGTSKTTNSTAWQMLYYNTNLAGSTNNRLEFKMLGYTTPTMSMIQGKVGIGNAAPTEALDVTGNAKVSGNLTLSGRLISAGLGASLGGTLNQTSKSSITFTDIANFSVNPNISEYRLEWAGLKSTGYGSASECPCIKVGTGGTTTTWYSTNYNGAVIRSGGAANGNNFYKEVTSGFIPIYPMISAVVWDQELSSSGSFTLKYAFAAGGGYIMKWDLTNVMYEKTNNTGQCQMVMGSGHIFIPTGLGKVTALGMFYNSLQAATTNMSYDIFAGYVQ